MITLFGLVSMALNLAIVPRPRIYILGMAGVKQVCMSKDNKYVACAGLDWLDVWDIVQGKRVASGEVPPIFEAGSEITSVGFVGDEPLVSDYSGRILRLSMTDKRFHTVRWFAGSGSTANSQLYAGGTEFAFDDRAGRVLISPVHNGEPRFVGKAEPWDSVAISENGRTVAVSDMAGVHLIDTHSKAVILRLKSGWPWGGRPILSKGGDEFLCQTGDLHAVLWNRRFGRRLLDDPVHGAMALSPDGKYIGLAEYPDYAEVWKIRPNGSIQRAAYTLGKTPHARYLHVSRCLAFSPDSRSLVISGSQGDVTIWRFLKGTSVTFQ